MKGNLQDLNLKLYSLLEDIHDPDIDPETNEPRKLTPEAIEKIKLTIGISNNIIGCTKLQLEAVKMAKAKNAGLSLKRISGCDLEVEMIGSPVKQ